MFGMDSDERREAVERLISDGAITRKDAEEDNKVCYTPMAKGEYKRNINNIKFYEIKEGKEFVDKNKGEDIASHSCEIFTIIYRWASDMGYGILNVHFYPLGTGGLGIMIIYAKEL